MKTPMIVSTSNGTFLGTHNEVSNEVLGVAVNSNCPVSRDSLVQYVKSSVMGKMRRIKLSPMSDVSFEYLTEEDEIDFEMVVKQWELAKSKAEVYNQVNCFEGLLKK